MEQINQTEQAEAHAKKPIHVLNCGKNPERYISNLTLQGLTHFRPMEDQWEVLHKLKVIFIYFGNSKLGPTHVIKRN